METSSKSVKYLVCVDGREESRVALRLAAMKARVRGGSVILLHVIPPADFQTLGGIAERMREERTTEAKQLLETLSNDAQEHYGIEPLQLLREGVIGDEIIAVAMEDPDIIMVVIAVAQETSARGTLATWLTGQLGNKLFIPLLMVPGNLTDQQLENLV